jgi:hypothetical protein
MSMIAVKDEKEENLPDADLKAVILHDDSDFAGRATALLERAAARAGEGTKWDVKSWHWDVLKQPALAAVTLTVAADADLILFALGEVHLPPPEVWDWLERWAANRRHADAAVMLLGPEGNASRRLRNKLERFAKRRGVAFLGGRKTEDDKAANSIIPLRPRRETLVAPTVPSFVEPLTAPSHWGIND